MIESVYQAKVGSLMSQIRAYQDRTDLINSDVGTQRVDQTNKSDLVTTSKLQLKRSTRRK